MLSFVIRVASTCASTCCYAHLGVTEHKRLQWHSRNGLLCIGCLPCLGCIAAHAATYDACRREEMRIEVKEADNVKLNVGLLRACSNERSLFCRGVQPGSARVFRCVSLKAGQQRSCLCLCVNLFR